MDQIAEVFVREELNITFLVCSTHEAAWLFKNIKRKTDKDDAIKLARLASLDQLKPTHIPNKQMRERRRLIKYRKILVGRVNKNKNTIRAIFANQGIRISSGAKTWHTGRVELDAPRKPLEQCEVDELWQGELDLELTQLDAVTEHLKQVDGKLRLARIGSFVLAKRSPNESNKVLSPVGIVCTKLKILIHAEHFHLLTVAS